MFIFGAGGHTKQCIDIFEMNNIKIEGIFDDNKKGLHYNYPIIDNISNAERYIDKNTEIFIGIGDNLIRENIVKKFEGYNFINCISNKANISKTIKIGSGNYIGQNVSILSDVNIGNFNILNENCIIPHDCSIGNNNHISILAILGGNVKIGNNNLLGLNSTVIPGIIIGNNNIIGAGSVVIKNISNNNKIVGNPAKYI